MVKVYNMETVRSTKLENGWYSGGLTVRLNQYETEEGIKYKVLTHIHDEGRTTEYIQTDSYNEALNAYEDVCVTYF